MGARDFTIADVQEARRELARRSLPDFACLADIPTVPLTDAEDEDRFSVMRLGSLAAHHQLLCEKLQGIDDGTIPNLMVLMPPGFGEEHVQRHRLHPVVHGAQGAPKRHPRQLRNRDRNEAGRARAQLVRSDSFARLIDVGLMGDNRAAHQWTLTNGSEFMAGGLLSGLTGNRGALGVLDDPIAGRAEAESETIRKRTWEAYVDDFCSRLIPARPKS